jgi:hypothetical protein
MRAPDPSFPLPEGEAKPLETLALCAIAVAVVAAAALWLAGELAGRIFAGAWPRVGAGEMGGVLVRLSQRPSDPAAAWPSRVGARLAARRRPGGPRRVTCGRCAAQAGSAAAWCSDGSVDASSLASRASR